MSNITISTEEYAQLMKFKEADQLINFLAIFQRQLLECVTTTERAHWPELVQKAFRFSEGDDPKGAAIFTKEYQ